MNDTFLMKLAQDLCISKDKLWVKVLRRKYDYGKHIIPQMNKATNAST